MHNILNLRLQIRRLRLYICSDCDSVMFVSMMLNYVTLFWTHPLSVLMDIAIRTYAAINHLNLTIERNKPVLIKMRDHVYSEPTRK